MSSTGFAVGGFQMPGISELRMQDACSLSHVAGQFVSQIRIKGGTTQVDAKSLLGLRIGPTV